jgi:hypothetical protein
MSQDVPDKHAARAVIDLRNQAKTVPLGIKNCVSSHSICRCESAAHIVEAPPNRPLRNSVPNIQRRRQFCMPFRCLQQSPSGNNVHPAPRLLLYSHFANLSIEFSAHAASVARGRACSICSKIRSRQRRISFSRIVRRIRSIRACRSPAGISNACFSALLMPISS